MLTLTSSRLAAPVQISPIARPSKRGFDAVDVPGVEHVEIHHDKANTRNRAVRQSLGFLEGPERSDGVHSGGEVGIDCSWRISRSDWEARESSNQASSS